MTIGADLIKQAYIIAKVVDPQEELEAYQSNQGLTSLNAIIDQWSSLQIYISSYTKLLITMTPGIYAYTVTPVITELLEANYLDANNVQFTLQPIDLKRQNTLNYVLGAQAQTLPNLIFVDSALPAFVTSSTVYFYPVPNAAYVATLYVKQRIANLDQSTDITGIPPFTFKALTCQLANDLSAINGTILTREFYDEYERVIKELKAANKQDMSVQNANAFAQRRQFRPWSRYA